jgi:hypothetical protein
MDNFLENIVATVKKRWAAAQLAQDSATALGHLPDRKPLLITSMSGKSCDILHNFQSKTFFDFIKRCW